MTRLAIGIGLAKAGDVSWLSLDLDPLPLTLSLTGGEVEISASPEDQLSISISGTSIYNGVYIVDPADLHEGPVNLAPPVIVGSPETGTVLTAQPGLWIYAGTALAAQPGLWIYEYTDTQPTPAYSWARDGVPIPGATGMTYTVVAEDAGKSLTVVEQVTTAAGTRRSESAGISVSALSVSRIGGFLSSGTPTNTPSFTVDLSGYSAGDIILVFYGTNTFATAATLDGQPFQKISADLTSGGTPMSAFAHTLTGPGSAESTITFTLPAASNAHVLSVHGIRNGAISDIAEAKTGGQGGTMSASVTPTTARNEIIACAMGVSFFDAVFTWTGIDAVETAVVPTATSRCISLGQRANVPVATHTVTGTPSGTGNTGTIVVAISEA